MSVRYKMQRIWLSVSKKSVQIQQMIAEQKAEENRIKEEDSIRKAETA
jgi:hypothetical protein